MAILLNPIPFLTCSIVELRHTQAGMADFQSKEGQLDKTASAAADGTYDMLSCTSLTLCTSLSIPFPNPPGTQCERQPPLQDPPLSL